MIAKENIPIAKETSLIAKEIIPIAKETSLITKGITLVAEVYQGGIAPSSYLQFLFFSSATSGP